MKKTLSLILSSVICLLLLAGCNAQTQKEVSGADSENEEIEENNIKTIYPLPAAIDINNLDNCTVAVSFEKGDVYVDDTGKAVMNMTVFAYDLYDMVDIANICENDVIVRLGEEVTVTDIERLESGLIRINGGEENGGFSLISDNNTVYFEVGMSDAKAYYELGKVILPVSVDFLYSDESDPYSGVKVYYPGDFLIEAELFEYNFNPHNTSVVIENGMVMAMKKVYTP